MSVKLNADILFEELSQHWEIKCIGKRKSDILFGRPEFVISQTQKLEKRHLYIGLADRLPNRTLIGEDVLIVCVGGIPPASYLHQNTVCFAVTGQTDLLTISNALTVIFNQYDEWENKLSDITEHSGDINELVSLATAVFRTPLMILDAQLHYLAYSACIDTRADLADYRPDAHGNVIPDKLSGLLKSYGTNMSVREPVYTTLLHNMLSVNLFNGQEALGSLTLIFCDRSRQPSDTSRALYFAAKVEEILARHRTSPCINNEALKTIVRDLLYCYPVDTNEWRKINPGDLQGTFLCLKILIRSAHRKVPLSYICNTFEQNFPGVILVEYEDSIVAVANLDILPQGESSLKAYMQNLLDDVDLVAGVSTPYQDLAMTRTYYRQASVAIEFGIREQSAQNYYMFYQYSLLYMLEQCNGEFPDEVLYRNGLQDVIRHDLVSNTDYIVTLRTYLDNNLNVTRTANDLHIHKTSLLARLKRIKGMLDVDFANPDHRLHLLLNLKMVK